MFHPLTVKNFCPSPLTSVNHLKLYEGYVKKTNELTTKLQTGDSDLRNLKTEFSFALNGVKNHEIYFGHLGGQGGEPQGIVAQAIINAWGLP
jgi:Fe-Mn family superoxide dismutase